MNPTGSTGRELWMADIEWDLLAWMALVPAHIEWESWMAGIEWGLVAWTT